MPDRQASMPAWMCKDCGYNLATRMSDLQQAEHGAYHLAALKRMRVARHEKIPATDWIHYARALERLDRLRQDERTKLRSRIVDLEESVTALEWDIKVLNELVDDLKADLAAVTEGRHQ